MCCSHCVVFTPIELAIKYRQTAKSVQVCAFVHQNGFQWTCLSRAHTHFISSRVMWPVTWVCNCIYRLNSVLCVTPYCIIAQCGFPWLTRRENKKWVSFVMFKSWIKSGFGPSCLSLAVFHVNSFVILCILVLCSVKAVCFSPLHLES